MYVSYKTILSSIVTTDEYYTKGLFSSHVLNVRLLNLLGKNTMYLLHTVGVNNKNPTCRLKEALMPYLFKDVT